MHLDDITMLNTNMNPLPQNLVPNLKNHPTPFHEPDFINYYKNNIKSIDQIKFLINIRERRNKAEEIRKEYEKSAEFQNHHHVSETEIPISKPPKISILTPKQILNNKFP